LAYKLLEAFKSLFEGNEYRHRDSTQGDYVASFLIDDVYSLNRSANLKAAVDSRQSVLNVRNKTVGRAHRRGDGSFGAAVPSIEPQLIPETYVVALGEVASIEIGAEVKIFAKAMIKQLDRVGTDMINQADEFKRSNPAAIRVGIVGINYANVYRGLEGEREYITTGRGGYAHPAQEAAQAEQRLVARVSSHFDELIVLRFVATNMPPLEFSWRDETQLTKEYGAALVRIAALYETRF
jgi:hypothetical protein